MGEAKIAGRGTKFNALLALELVRLLQYLEDISWDYCIE
jgi:hypothetical protein